MSLSKLKKKSQKYTDDDQAITELRQRKAAAQAELSELENDTTGDIDTLADQAAKANSVIQDADFRINALEKRQKIFRAEIVEAINAQRQAHQQYERDLQKRRRERAEAVIESPEFQGFLDTLRALYATGNFYTFDAVLSQAIPKSCDFSESKEIAVRDGLWIDEDDISPIVREAERAVMYDDYDARRTGVVIS